MPLVMMRSPWSRRGPESNMTGVLIKKGNLDTDRHAGRTPGEEEADIRAVLCKPQNARSHTGMEHVLPPSFRRNQPSDTLISAFQPPGWRDTQFLLSEPPTSAPLPSLANQDIPELHSPLSLLLLSPPPQVHHTPEKTDILEFQFGPCHPPAWHSATASCGQRGPGGYGLPGSATSSLLPSPQPTARHSRQAPPSVLRALSPSI